MDTKLNNKFFIKIPKNIFVLYNPKSGFIIFKTEKKTATFVSKVKIEIQKKNHLLHITNTPIKLMAANENKKLKAVQGLTVAKIKQLLIELTEIFYKKLKFVGVGYRALPLKKFHNIFHIFSLKLGLSHVLYLNSKDNYLQISCLKLTKLFICGNSYATVNQTAAIIRSFKTPEPYKGKGLLYENETIKLKEGKKI